MINKVISIGVAIAIPITGYLYTNIVNNNAYAMEKIDKLEDSVVTLTTESRKDREVNEKLIQTLIDISATLRIHAVSIGKLETELSIGRETNR